MLRTSPRLSTLLERLRPPQWFRAPGWLRAPRWVEALARRKWLVVAVLAVLGLTSLAALSLALFLGQVPLPNALPGPQSSRVLAADGEVLAVLHGEQNRTLVPLSEIAPDLANAVVSTEDRGFYQHRGVSLRGIVRAFFANVREGGIREGGSTITQQYVRNAFTQVGRERTLFRKLKEMALSAKLEARYSKNKILEFYLNTVYFGRGAYGAEAAARAYFDKAAADLTLPEAAFLAGAIRSPERYQTNDVATPIRDEVLGDMIRAGTVSPAIAEQAKQAPVALADPSKVPETLRAGFFVEFVRRQLKASFDLTDREIFGGGLVVHTTLNLGLQEAAERAIATTLDRADDPEVALVALDVEGRVRAMVGGRNFSDPARTRGFNFAWQRAGGGGRQAGSAFKPFTLAAFLDRGYSVYSRFSAPSSTQIRSHQCRNSDGSPWRVRNFGGASYGSLTVAQATARSVNTVYAQMVDVVRPGTVAAIAEQIGGWRQGSLPQVCSLALGTAGVTPLEMARAFATFAGRGMRPDVIAVERVVGPGGRTLAERYPRRVRVLQPNVADSVNKVLQEVLTRGTARSKGIGRPAAGKTGTTQRYLDAWFVGYTPTLVSAVWMGYPADASGRVREMSDVHGREVTGGSFPATMWQKFMSEAVEGTAEVEFEEPRLKGRVIGRRPCPTEGASPGAPAGASPSSPACPTPSPGDPGSGLPPGESAEASPGAEPGPAGSAAGPSP